MSACDGNFPKNPPPRAVCTRPAVFIGGPLDRRDDIVPHESYKGHVFYALNIECSAPVYAEATEACVQDVDPQLLPYIREYKCEFITAAGNSVYTYVDPEPETKRFTVEVKCIGGEKNEMAERILRETVQRVNNHPSAFRCGVGVARIVKD